MSKTAKSFRLSPQALETLAYLAGLTGSNETAIVEISLAHFRKTFEERQFQREERKAPQGDPEPPPNFPEYIQPVSGKKKKRRRRK